LPEEKFSLSLAPVPEYTNDVTKEQARKNIQYNLPDPLIVYTGKLGMDVQEVKYILQAAKILPQYWFLFTGGRASAVSDVKAYCQGEGINNVILTGFLTDSTKIRDYQLAADVLVSYYTSKDHLVEFNYPQKVNEYLSTGNPVITPDHPATRDVLNDSNVFFVQPDSPPALAKGIKQLIEDPVLSSRLASNAKEAIKPLSFPQRAKVWVEFLEKLSD
jgi:glycosyltransferase involved in cell wall biosynthesis